LIQKKDNISQLIPFFKMSEYEFKKIISSDNITFWVHTQHPIFKRGIFCEFNQNEKVPLTAHTLNLIIYQYDITIKNMPELLRQILPLSLIFLEEKCKRKLEKQFIKLNKNFKKSNIDVIQIIQSFEEPVIYEDFFRIVIDRMAKNYILNKEIILNDIIIEQHFNWASLLNYDNFDISIFENYDKLRNLFKHDNVIEHIMKNINLDSSARCGFKPIHFLCKYGSPKIIRWMLEQNYDFECEDEEKKRPIHHFCKYQIPELIELMIEKGVNLECEDIFKKKPIDYLCDFPSPGMMKLMGNLM